ncbi:2-oxoacid:acceptor oxidoreductase subunit alpha [Candidatus Woesearchaeota archaeon]|nr:2-oxoacid:acceptor oxidoreductase subunit alpha [Candidatus Woesearchaeota archaeon]
MTKKLLQGNEAICLGAIKAGMKFFAGYPITPASEIMHFLSRQKDIGFVHAEDEIAAINMVIGASLGGAKSMTATSGPGFSLKQEGIGLAHMMEVPVVVVDCQRVGPSTGMPTLGSQGDILQSAHGSHGDIFPIVFYPNSVEECYKYTIEAFNAAEDSQSPVILLTDTSTSHIYETADTEEIDKAAKIRQRTLEPFGKGTRHFTGLAHEKDAPKTRDSENYKRWIKRTKEKQTRAANNYSFYEYMGQKDSDTLLVAYGITSRVISPLRDRFAIFRPIRLFPILDELKIIAKDFKNIVVIEQNEGQYLHEVEVLLKRKIQGISVQGGEVKLSGIEEQLKVLGLE